ncbi:MAG: DUF1232 domain-containing protein [Firmicutes bacterium]|jgi:uncharacterized membrane protein YkvA (DUF1232 family)|nr:DUF1232 domain-containing protein [Bacillota bacterium]
MNKLLVFELIRYIPSFFKDKNVPIYEKITSILILLYIINPFDIIPETLFGVGLIDDGLILLYFYHIIKENYKNTNNKRKKQKNVIENVEYNVKD